MPKPRVFISHIHEEAALAALIKDELIEPHLLGAVDLFVSSDFRTNPGGTSWLSNIEENLLTAAALLIVASPDSIRRPWINIEAGAAWLRSLQARHNGASPVFVMPLCHSNLTPGQLPLPWSTFNAVEVRTAGGLQQVLETIARAAGIRAPTPDLTPLATKVQALEKQYTFYREIEGHITDVLAILGDGFKPMFLQQPPPSQYWKLDKVVTSILVHIEPHLLWLKAQGYIDYRTGGVLIQAGVGGASQSQDVLIRPSDNFVANIVPHLSL